jgi:DNA (cytosine-5)-methyltransferase 1
VTRTITAVDAFCGAGGTSTGLALACHDIGANVDLLAINHWDVAVQTHSANHPWARHLQSRIESVRPRDAFPGGRLDLLVASPECTHHSTARGGRPVSDQLRASAWHLIPWLEELRVDAMLIENVPEFRSWCRVGRNGRPVKKEKGAYFREWVRAIKTHGYNVDWKIVNSADYGDATSRQRLFVMARRGNRPIVWPQPLYSRRGKTPGTKTWRAARDIIDWSLKGKSIFERERPLAPRTLARIMEGLRRFGGEELRPFLVLMEHGGGVRSVEDPVPTITTARGGSMGVAEPFTVGVCGRNLVPKSVDDPLPTQTHRSTRWLIESEVQPFTLSTDRPVTNRSLPRSTEEPIATVVANNERIWLAEPFIVPNFGEREGQVPRTHSVEDPLPSPTSHGAGGLAEPFLTMYYGTSTVSSIDAPIPAIPTHDRFALVQPVINGRALDIRFRMLEPRELAAAMGFPSDYAFTGNRTDIVRQIGNAVAVQTARWLCLALLGGTVGPTTLLEAEAVAV